MNTLVKLKDAIAAKLEVVTASQAANLAKFKLATLEKELKNPGKPGSARAAIQEMKANNLMEEVNALQPVAEPKAAVTPTAPPRTAASFRAKLPSGPSAAVVPPTTVATVVPAQFATKPDFSALHGMERATASMRWNTEREAHFLAEATKQIEAEEAAARPPSPYAGLPATAENLAKSLIYEQAEAAKPKVSAWSQAGADRSKAIKARAAELKKSASI